MVDKGFKRIHKGHTVFVSITSLFYVRFYLYQLFQVFPLFVQQVAAPPEKQGESGVRLVHTNCCLHNSYKIVYHVATTFY